MDNRIKDLEQIQEIQKKYIGRIDIMVETRQDMQKTCVVYTNYGTRNDNPKYRLVSHKLSWFNDNSKEIEEIKKDLFNIVGF